MSSTTESLHAWARSGPRKLGDPEPSALYKSRATGINETLMGKTLGEWRKAHEHLVADPHRSPNRDVSMPTTYQAAKFYYIEGLRSDVSDARPEAGVANVSKDEDALGLLMVFGATTTWGPAGS